MHSTREEIDSPLVMKTGEYPFSIFPDDPASKMLSVLPGIPAHAALDMAGALCERAAEILLKIERGQLNRYDMEWAMNFLLSIASAMLHGVQNGDVKAKTPF